jgi:hypothetical protein
LFLLNRGCRHPSSGNQQRERENGRAQYRQGEHRKQNRGERAGKRKKRDRERGRKSNEREAAHRKTEKEQENTEGRTFVPPAHHTFIIVFAVSRESISKKRKIETNTSFTSVRHCL